MIVSPIYLRDKSFFVHCCVSLHEKLFFYFSDTLIEQAISVSVDGLIWTFFENILLVSYSSLEIGEKNDEQVCSRSSYDGMGKTLSSIALSWVMIRREGVDTQSSYGLLPLHHSFLEMR